MLTLNRRHSPKCKKSKHFDSTELDRCTCPLIVMGMDNRNVYHNREALGTRDKYVAQQIIRDIEERKIVRPRKLTVELTLQSALERYLMILASQRGLKPATIRSYQFTFDLLTNYAKKKKIEYMREISSTLLTDWIGEWTCATSSRVLRIGVIKRFFEYAAKDRWIPEDPSNILMAPTLVRTGATVPFDLDTELPRIMEAIPNWIKGRHPRLGRLGVWSRRPEIASALLTTLRFTGLRISDAMMFNPRALVRQTFDGDEMYLYYAMKQKKTDQPVFIPLFPEDVEPIIKTPWMSEKYAFWDGVTPMHYWCTQFHAAVLEPLGKLVGIPVHAHRFRDTFAVDLLDSGADVRTVSRLLGHKNISTTMNFYEHYLKSDSDKLVEIISAGKRTKREGKVIPFVVPTPKQA